ncbi:TatD family hydrolase [Buchnera aphidicola]|uniref:TatD family hydrolase n=1 Tax=Buchnera aphidicola TaxID=9 RepID=UPI0034645DFF
MYFIDSHCHLNLLKHKNSKQEINKFLKQANNTFVKLFLTVATSIKDYQQNFKLFKEYSSVLYSIGIHPLNSSITNLSDISKFKKEISQNNKIIAFGETGLDYYHPLHNKIIQKKIFLEHLKMGCELKKPIIIHTRNSEIDLLNILSSKECKNCTGVIHSYTGDIFTARKLLNLGFYISFSGIVTFKNAKNIKNTLKFIPIDRILLETDSPYLTPEPYRGKENQPSNLFIIAKYISKLKNIDLYTLSQETKKNFNKLFNTKY